MKSNSYELSCVMVMCLLTMFFVACNDDDGNPVNQNETALFSISFGTDNEGLSTTLLPTTFDEEEHLIGFIPPHNVNVADLKPTIVLAEGASIAPSPADVTDFSETVRFTITARDGTTTYYDVVVVTPTNNDVRLQKRALMDILKLNVESHASLDFDTLLDLANWNSERIKLNESSIIDALYLNGADLINLPNSIGYLAGLKYLNLEHNDLTTLPEEMRSLYVIEELVLSFNEFDGRLPELIYDLRSLRRLHLRHVQLYKLSPRIGELINLTYLNMGNSNSIQNPENELNKNKLYFVPGELAALDQLSYFSVQNNPIRYIPMALCNRADDMDTFSAGISYQCAEATQIAFLDDLVEANDITWDELMSSNLAYGATNAEGFFIDLFLSSIGLNEIPESIGELSALEELSLSNNAITALPETITQLEHLTILYLNRNSLTVLPASIGELSALEELHLSDNAITALPETITQLKHLTVLRLNNNSLTVLSASIGELSALEELNLSNNAITALPETITQLQNLEFLNLATNPITTLPGHVCDWIMSENVGLSYSEHQNFCTN